MRDILNPGERDNMTDEDYRIYRKEQIRSRLAKLSEDLIQALAGEFIPDIDSRRNEFVQLHNELRVLEGKDPRSVEHEV